MAGVRWQWPAQLAMLGVLTAAGLAGIVTESAWVVATVLGLPTRCG
jgi:hypothetical protein